MRDFVDLGGTTPPEEACAQVGSREYDYADRAKREARAYVNLLRRTFGSEPDGAWLGIKAHPHDFGTYLTVICYFENDNAAAFDYAQNCEIRGPMTWDDEACVELGLNKERSDDHANQVD